jgi:acyl carrier protein
MPCGLIWRQRRPTTDRRPPLNRSQSPRPRFRPRSAVSRRRSILSSDKVLGIVAEQTGYPLEMLDLDLDMEADLGIDTVKQAETFQAIRNAFDIPRRDDLKLRDYPTLGAVIGFVYAMRPDLAPATAVAVSRRPNRRPPLNRSQSPRPRFRPRSAVTVGGRSRD